MASRNSHIENDAGNGSIEEQLARPVIVMSVRSRR